MKKITLGILLLFCSFLQAQMTVNGTQTSGGTQTLLTPTQIVSNYLLGPGVTYFNAIFNRVMMASPNRDQCGYFQTPLSPTNLGFAPFSKGVLLTTGKSIGALGPNTSSSFSSLPAIPIEGDADLALLSGKVIRNVAILEFDFVATGLELNFDYVFGSEEYNEYVNSSFNDVFGFFLSGPGISGPYSSPASISTTGAKNIALIPGTSTGVSINTINNGMTGAGPCMNCDYYVSNTANNTQYDGFTKLLRATSDLQCGGIYHIKLAIANASDNSLDSGVFLQNFTIPRMVLTVNGSNENLSACYGEVQTITSGYDGTEGYDFVWSKDGIVIPDENGPTLKVTSDGTYSLTGNTNGVFGPCQFAFDDIEIKFAPNVLINDPVNLHLSTTSAPPFTFNINQTAAILGSENPNDYEITYYDSSFHDAINGSLTGRVPKASLANYTVSMEQTTIWIRFDNLNTGCSVVKSFDILVNQAETDKIKLIAYIDQNANGTKDSNEGVFSYGSFIIQKNNTETPTVIASPNGIYFLLDDNPENTYDFNYQINPEYAAYYSATATNFNDLNIPEGSGTQTLYFPVTISQTYSDASVTVIPLQAPRPGSSYTNRIEYKNLGITATSGTLTFTKPAPTTITTINQAGVANTADGFTFDFSNLAPNEIRSMLVTMSIPTIPMVNIGDLLTSSASITASENDIDLKNNTFSNTQTAVGAFDPNDIMEAHGEKITFSDFGTDEYLTYTIRFQNTGTASAEKVRLENGLDTRLDSQSIRMVSSSHDYVMERVNNSVTWQFDNINLTWKNQNEEASKGYVTYQIKLKPGFEVGDIIPNHADIYFDFNPAITTNTFNTEFTAQLGNATFTSENIVLYPNPTHNQINVSLQNSAENLNSIKIYDILGNTMKKADKLTSNQSSIDVSNLAKGIYLMEINTESQLKLTKKLIIE